MILNILRSYLPKEKTSGETASHVYGAIYQRPRLQEVLSYCFGHSEGDAIEIGCMSGGTSRFLAEECHRFGRTLVCVDPWLPMPKLLPHVDFDKEYGKFMKNIEPFADNVRVVRGSSLDDEIIAQIQEHQYAFAFVDGDHSTGAVIRDLRTVAPITDVAIASDDHRYNQRVVQAHVVMSEELKDDWTFHDLTHFREAWFIHA